MKTTKYFLLLLIGLIGIVGCDKGIDSITAVTPGPDESAPEVTITYPQEGTQIRVLEEVTSITIKFEVTDDIEIAAVDLSLNGEVITTFSEFKDYRRFLGEYTYEELTSGDHELTVTARDLDGKSTSETVTFRKVSPYTPKYVGETLYMPFNGDFIDLVNLRSATVIGSPKFAGESVISGEGENAYKGEPDSYITLPGEDYQADEFSAVFWLKVSDSPDRAGILTMSAPDPDNPDKPNNRNFGFRVLREATGSMQRFKVNMGTGESDVWLDGGAAADVDPAAGEWTHFAFTVSPDNAVFYINGQPVKENEIAGIDWTGCDLLSVMSGAPRFTEWDHLSGRDLMDELRFFDRTLSEEEIQSIIADESGKVVSGYEPKYDGEVFYMPFEEEYLDKVSDRTASEVGNPGFASNGLIGMAYKGAADSYLTFPTDDFMAEEISFSFWINIVEEPDRAGVITISPPDEDDPDHPNNRTAGLRILHENAGGMQRFKLNVGTGEADVWVDGGDKADVDPGDGEWVHIAAVISGSEAALYIDGNEVQRSDIDGISWDGCKNMSIMSGAPFFTGWDHFSDEGAMDELRIFNKALSPVEIQEIINDVE